jgi:uncharacterized protein with ACT and thioredoxin-like domain
MTMGMGLDGEAMHHVAVLAECHELVLATHLMADHDLTNDTLVNEMKDAHTLIMLHMSLHGHVIQVDTGEQSNEL